MQIEVYNFLEGPNSVRLFRNEKLVDASACGSSPQANFDDTDLAEEDKERITELSTINDFIKIGQYYIGGVKVGVNPPDCIEYMDGHPVIHFCGWDINTKTEKKDIILTEKLSDTEFASTTDFVLNIKAQVGIKFLKKGRVTIFFAPSNRMDMSRGFGHQSIFEQFKKPDFLK